MSKQSSYTNPNLVFGVISIVLAIVVTFGLKQLLNLDSFLWPWLLAINTVTFFVYGYDKMTAKRSGHHTRTPEFILLLLALIGGTIGAIAGMVVFHHKTSKNSFKFWFIVVVVVQIAALALYWFVLRPA